MKEQNFILTVLLSTCVFSNPDYLDFRIYFVFQVQTSQAKNTKHYNVLGNIQFGNVNPSYNINSQGGIIISQEIFCFENVDVFGHGTCYNNEKNDFRILVLSHFFWHLQCDFIFSKTIRFFLWLTNIVYIHIYFLKI